MKRFWYPIVFYLLAGLATSIFVGAGAAVLNALLDKQRIELPFTTSWVSSPRERASLAWLWPPPPDWPAPDSGTAAWNLLWSSHGRSVPMPAQQRGTTPGAWPQSHLTQDRLRAGVPFRSLQSRTSTDTATPMRTGTFPARRMWLEGENLFATTGARFASASLYVIPLRPYWPGLLADSAFFALAWRLAVAMFIRARNRSRTRRGLCVKCKYDLKDLPTCPECGTPVPRTPQATVPRPPVAITPAPTAEGDA